MSKIYVFKVGDKVIVNDNFSGTRSNVRNKEGVVESIQNSLYPYRIAFEDGTTDCPCDENELTLVESVEEQVVEEAVVEPCCECKDDCDCDECWEWEWSEEDYDPACDCDECTNYRGQPFMYIAKPERIEGKFEAKAKEIGAMVDAKQVAYGNSVEKAYRLMKIFMEKYENGNGTYTIPEELLKHMLLMVRIIDKQNRIFNNPSQDLMEENTYRDLAGYSLLGEDMSDR